MPVDVDPITEEVIRYSLVALMDDVEADLVRTAFSPHIYEYKDYCVGLLDLDGRLIAQSRNGSPMFLASLGAPLLECLRAWGGVAGFASGDVVITNDPGTVGQHLNNVIVYRPVFIDGEAVAFVAATAHWADVGGQVLGSNYVTTTTDVFQEGVQFNALKPYKRGVPDPEVLRMILSNSRLPDQVLGDLQAQVAACVGGERRLGELVARYGLSTVREAVSRIWARSEALMRERIRQLPDGVYRAESWLDGDGLQVKAIPLPITVTVSGDEITVDYSEISPQVKGPWNSGAQSGGVASARVALKMVTSPEESANEGAFRPLHVILPEGKILSAKAGAPIAKWSSPIPTVVETILRALSPALPDRVPAGSHGACMGTYTFSGMTAEGRPFLHSDTAQGGYGAFAWGDGPGPFKSVTHGDSHDVPVEVQESLYPLFVESYRFRTDSAGDGEFRGGLGSDKTYVVPDAMFLSASFDRTSCPPWGLAGGTNGDTNRVEIEEPGADVRRVHKATRIPIQQGTRVRVRSGGGGGYGDPRSRSRDRLAADIEDGYISLERAREIYGEDPARPAIA